MPYKCKKCNKGFLNNNKLNRHYNRKISCIKGEIIFKCDKCRYIFKSRSNLKKHQKKKKPCIIIQDTQCTYCKKIFSDKYSLKRHKKLYCKIKDSARLTRLEDTIELLKEHIEKNDSNPTVNNIVNNIYNDNRTTNYININNFNGNMDIDHLNAEHLKHALNMKDHALISFSESVNFHPNRPQNYNIRLLKYIDTTSPNKNGVTYPPEKYVNGKFVQVSYSNGKPINNVEVYNNNRWDISKTENGERINTIRNYGASLYDKLIILYDKFEKDLDDENIENYCASFNNIKEKFKGLNDPLNVRYKKEKYDLFDDLHYLIYYRGYFGGTKYLMHINDPLHDISLKKENII
jgi:uncharacterized C2H2 Zn-finger protein